MHVPNIIQSILDSISRKNICTDCAYDRFLTTVKKKKYFPEKREILLFFRDNKIVAKHKFYYWNSDISPKSELMVSPLCHLRFRLWNQKRSDPLHWFQFRPK